ncbi:MAG: PadR family transcriptional regulator [Actinomycetota bacterium]
MREPSTATYSLLGLLAIRPWAGYELTQQARRSLRLAWASSEAHLYREQKHLVELGWATVSKEPVGKRSRNRYSITTEGRDALRRWLRTEPAVPRFEVEAIVRTFFGDQGDVEDLSRALRHTSASAREMIDQLTSYAAEYVETGGPFPERLHVIAIAAQLVTELLAHIDDFCENAASEVDTWPTTEGLGMTGATRRRLEEMLALRD